ncbi:MAG: AmmeMemoRadiSam system protein B [Treponema sp.]|jgi:AmmeMemoRadiSam system protein B|nr:AmmeMemoRadiSam system protein B [Treponema sp.]
MQIREYSLTQGWYPRDPEEVKGTISRFLAGKDISRRSRCAISPHAGWFYSGRIASIGAASLERDAETVAVIGGHLSDASPVLFAMEDAVRTPFGVMQIDKELRAALKNELDGEEDKFRDNTVEVLLPLVHYFFPKAMLLWIRLPAAISSYEAGKIISQVSKKLSRKINVLGSTDLTHYGRNYGFMPQGSGRQALRWVSEVNDANFIKAVEGGNSNEVLLRAEKDYSACSAGAVLGAMGFADDRKLGGAKLLEYGTSADAQSENTVPDSFVGYASMAFVSEQK